MVDLIVSGAFLVVLLIGLFGTVFPIFPGILLMWATVVSYGFVAGFDAVGIGVIVIVTVLTVISFVLGFTLPKQAADAAGASKKAQWAALLGAIIGFFAIPVVGIIVGAVAGIALAEYQDKQDRSAAWQSTKGVLVGMGWAVLAEIVIGVTMIAIWLAWAAIATL